MQPRPVAVYAPLAAPLYQLEPGPVGGAEVQSGYLARALADRGFRVVHIVSGQDLVRSRDGIEVVRLDEDYLRRGLTRRRAVVRALRASRARIFIQRSAGYETGLVAAFARSTGKRFVFSSSSIGDFVLDRFVSKRSGASLDEWPTRLQYLIGLHLAHAVVVQTEEQQHLAASERGVRSRVIRSFCAPREVSVTPRRALLWIGGLVRSKDPLAYVELARRVPEATFWMIAGDRGSLSGDLPEKVRSEAELVPNLDLLSTVARDELLALYPQAVAVVNTSLFEGFPNTSLEAWASGTPVLSLRVDPDSVIERHGLGEACGGSHDRLAEAVRRLWAERDAIDPAPLREYVARVHDPGVVGPQWASLVEELLGG